MACDSKDHAYAGAGKKAALKIGIRGVVGEESCIKVDGTLVIYQALLRVSHYTCIPKTPVGR